MAARRAKSARRDALAGASLNLTPLLDVIFNLLFFFLLATNLRDRQQYLEVTLPTATTGESRDVPDQVPVITLAPDGRMQLDGKDVTNDELRVELVTRVREKKLDQVVVESDAGVPVQRFFDAADICRQAGIPTVMPNVKEPKKH